MGKAASDREINRALLFLSLSDSGLLRAADMFCSSKSPARIKCSAKEHSSITF